MRCPACGAHNPDSAEWCTQCFAALTQGPPGETQPEPAIGVVGQREPGAQPIEDDPGALVDTAADADRERAEDGGSVTTADSRFRRTSEGIDWQCEVCEVWNPIERTTCKSCHQPFARTVADAPSAPTRQVSESTALLTSALVPGTGHILLGRTASGVARAVMFIIWLAGGLVLLREASASQQSILPAVPLLAGALVLWLATTVDVLALVQGSRTEILRPRVFLWLAIGVLGLVMVSFLASAVQLPGVLKSGGAGG